MANENDQTPTTDPVKSSPPSDQKPEKATAPAQGDKNEPAQK